MNKQRLVVPFVLLALVGAGCQPGPSAPSAPQGQAPTAPPAPKMGFGKLPSIGATGALGSPEAVSMRATDATSQAAPMMAAGTVTANGSAMAVAPSAAPMPADANAMLKVRPIPSPPNLKPVGIKYNLTASMPDLPSESDVLEVHRATPDASSVRSFAQAYGLPSSLVGGIKTVQSVNASWLDADEYQWSMDGASGMINWWKQQDQNMQPMADGQEDAPAKVDDAKVLAAADAFLRSHGLGAVADQGGVVEQYDNQPCLMKADPASAPTPAPDTAVATDAGVSTMIYPSPCRYFPVQANVYYGSTRDGKPVVDMGGWPSRMSSVNVDTATLQVMSGNVVYSEQTERSSYPLLDQATVLSRLQAGGRNPVYPWGNETKDIQVTIDKIELAWLRYDSWDNGIQQTYYLPAIAASGHVDRGIKGQDPEEYHTTVALVKDDAFGDVAPQPTPMPYMIEGSSGSGGAVASPPMMVK
ncbi:MAG TPA: hypothetical protein VMU11_04100 [Verrucomicrobiae bacterium]|nr:hypothetical protein [Verrucomicrobiae bacterium]